MPSTQPRRGRAYKADRAALASERALWDMAAHLFLDERRFSRNRHFEAFNDPRFRPALVVYRRLRALLADLEAARTNPDARLLLVEEERQEGHCVRLELMTPRARRTAWLEQGAFDVLMRHPAARAAFDALRHR